LATSIAMAIFYPNSTTEGICPSQVFTVHENVVLRCFDGQVRPASSKGMVFEDDNASYAIKAAFVEIVMRAVASGMVMILFAFT
jgi:hypothetical protein